MTCFPHLDDKTRTEIYKRVDDYDKSNASLNPTSKTHIKGENPFDRRMKSIQLSVLDDSKAIRYDGDWMYRRCNNCYFHKRKECVTLTPTAIKNMISIIPLNKSSNFT